MKNLRLLAFAACLSLVAASALPQGLGKGKGNQGGQSTGGGQSSGNQGGLGKGQGGGQTTGGGQSSGGGLGRGRGDQGGQSTGGGQSSGNQGGLGKGRGDQGGRSNGGGQSSGNQGGGLGRGQGGGQTTGGGNQGGGLGNQGGSGRGKGDQGGGQGNSGGNQGGLGRVGNPPDRVNSIGKGSDQGRTGRTSYGSNNNLGNRGQGIRIEAPRLNLNKGSLQSQVFRSETVRVNSGWRDGYYGYNNSWRDDSFYYPYYAFNPWGRQSCTISPWYFYAHLPGYLFASRIQYYDGTRCNWGYGSPYNWSEDRWDRGGDRDYRGSELDGAIYDIERAFERQDRRALGRLVPSRGRVNIYIEDQYCYSLSGDDFYDLMLDNIQSTETIRYSINRVTTYRDEAQVSAVHEFYDSWGRRQCVYHHYRLESDRYGYVITDFRSGARM